MRAPSWPRVALALFGEAAGIAAGGMYAQCRVRR